MIKKIGLIIMTSIYLNFMSPLTILAYNSEIININETTLTKEQKLLLIEKKEELKEKYLQDWKNKTKEEKMEALKAYKEEMDEFCLKEFGLTFKELKEKYKDYFKNHPR